MMIVAPRRSGFLQALYQLNRTCASQSLHRNFYEGVYNHLIGTVSCEMKRLLCLIAKVCRFRR